MDLPNNSVLEFPVATFKPDEINAPTCYREKEDLKRRQMVKLFRGQSAEEFIDKLTPGAHRFGFTKGQFSLVDVVHEISDQIGPCHFTLSTWTVAVADLGELQALCNKDRMLSVRMLLDFSFQRRQPQLIAHIRKVFGSDKIAITKNHAKFCLMANDQWKIVVRTSMNLNFNPRLEDLEIKDDPALFDFVNAVITDIFSRYAKKDQTRQSSSELAGDFAKLIN